MIGKPKKKTVKQRIKKVIKDAHYKSIDTGEKREVKIFDKNGKERIEKQSIVNRVYVDPVVEEKDISKEVWVVETERFGQKEQHEFSSKEAANNFHRSSR